MASRTFGTFAGITIALAVAGFPLLGAVLAGRNAREYFRFPPSLDIPVDYPMFSWVAAVGVVAIVVAVAAPWVLSRCTAVGTVSVPPRSLADPDRGFPRWGVAALVWTAAWWFLAWTRLDWFAPLQRYTFFPLWLGFILTVNASTTQRTGSCLMRRKPRRWVALFAVSAACWWGFEWLNRFVLNWHYLGVENFGPLGYAVHASLCFSTVLPAVAAVAEWIASHPAWTLRTSAGPRWTWLNHRPVGAALLLAGAAALLGTGARPLYFYAALWVAPLALLIAASVLLGYGGLPDELARGDWRRGATWMLAALTCGFFWELWNWRSEAKWIYTVPGVERWHVFEMPLLGYAGYLPFGLECLLVAERVIGNRWFPGPETVGLDPLRLRASPRKPA